AYVSWFNFKGPQQQRKVGSLSGGERNRVHLAKLLQKGSNLLLLDEPTNDLDVDTLRALEEALVDFAGCAVVISHDRWFLDRIATHMVAFEGDSRVVWFEGNYQDYEADRRQRLGAEADQPHRLRYRPPTPRLDAVRAMAMVCVASAWPRVRSGCEGDAGHRRAAATQPLAKLRRPGGLAREGLGTSSGGACDGTTSRRAALLAQALLAQAQTVAI